jgi:hypothetical protein
MNFPNVGGVEPEGRPIITATPYEWVDPRRVPRRQWLYRPHYIRKFVSVTIGPGGVAKTSLMLAEALAMVSGKPLLGIEPAEPLTVWYWNGEDPLEEMQRRISAAALEFKVTKEDLGDRLLVDSGRDTPVIIASEGRDGLSVDEAAKAQLVTTILDHKIDVVIIDPFIACHRVSENSNDAIEAVVTTWADIAEKTNAAVMLGHHSRKTGGVSSTVEDGRGASALLAAARTARTVNKMTATEAGAARVDDYERWRYLRVDIGKTNMTRPNAGGEWYRLESVELNNGGPYADSPRGDQVGVVTPWTFPVAPDPTAAEVLKAQAEMKAGGPWRKDQQAPDWVGIPIGRVLGRDITEKAQRAFVAKVVKAWIEAGWLVVVEREDKHRKSRPHVEVGEVPKSMDEEAM